MKKLTVAIVGVLACALASSFAVAEPKGQPKGKGGPPGPQVRYFDLSSDIFSDLNAEVILKERRQGAALVAAELDVCHLASPNSSQLDQFVVPLKVEGNRLIGTVQSQEGKRPVAVSLTRRVVGGNFNYEGSIKSGTYSEDVSSTGNAEMSEQEYQESYATEDEMQTAPTDFTEASPQALIIRVNRAGLSGLLNELRNQNVRIVLGGLALSCAILRSGRFDVQLDVDPDRAGAILAKIKSLPGVSAVGYGPSEHNWERAIRFPSAGWRDADGKLNRDKFAGSVGGIIGNTLAAKVSSSTWDNTTGRLTIVLNRPDDTITGLKLSQVLTFSILVAPASPTSNQQSLLWVENIGLRVVDEAAGAKLQFQASDDEGAEPDGSEGLMEAIAATLKGQVWDSENEDWQ